MRQLQLPVVLPASTAVRQTSVKLKVHVRNVILTLHLVSVWRSKSQEAVVCGRSDLCSLYAYFSLF